MPRYAEEVRFSHEPNAPAFSIDGEEFPWYVANNPRIEVSPVSGHHTVHVAILAERVVVVDATGQSGTREVK